MRGTQWGVAFATAWAVVAWGGPAKDGAGAEAVLKQSVEAIAKVRVLGYHAESVIEKDGTIDPSAPKHSASVVAGRADAGGWKLAVKGEVTTIKDGTPEITSIQLGFDGVQARAIVPQEQSIFERSAVSLNDVETFFREQSAWKVVFWSMLAETPMRFAPLAATMEAPRTIGGEECDVLAIGLVASSTSNTDAPGEDELGTSFRLAIARSDHLPRMVERTIGGRVHRLTLSEVKTDRDVAGWGYTLAVPDGYRVRTGAKPRTNIVPETDDPNPLAGPGVRRPSGRSATGSKPGEHRTDPGMLAVGDQAPDFSLKDPSGKAWTLADYKGKVLVLDFWGSWCPPCRKAMPGVQRLHEKFKNKKVAIVGINKEHDPKADPAAFMSERNYTYQLLLDADPTLGPYKIQGFPSFYVIDANGKVVYGSMGHSPAHEREIASVVESLLSDSGSTPSESSDEDE